MIQGGDPKGNGKGGPGYTIADEYPTWKDPYKKYTIAMANAGTPHSGGSQFFINTQNNSKLLPPELHGVRPRDLGLQDDRPHRRHPDRWELRRDAQRGGVDRQGNGPYRGP